jgi:ribosomal protein S18 acetylase RimI-like enzyme
MDYDDCHPVLLTPERLADEDVDWNEEVARFEPLDHEAGQQAAAWLREQVAAGCPSSETYLLYSGTYGVLGFVALQPVYWRLPRNALAIVNLRRRPQLKGGKHLGLLIAWIARDRSTPAGFGEELVLGSIRRARSDPQYVALFVDPANERVAELWRTRYRFRGMARDDPSAGDRLWLPVDPPPDIVSISR